MGRFGLNLREQLEALRELFALGEHWPEERQALLAGRLTNTQVAWTMVFTGRWSTGEADDYIERNYVPNDDIPF